MSETREKTAVLFEDRAGHEEILLFGSVGELFVWLTGIYGDFKCLNFEVLKRKLPKGVEVLLKQRRKGLPRFFWMTPHVDVRYKIKEDSCQTGDYW